MKRRIYAATHKREALEALKAYEETIFYDEIYKVEIDKKRNCVVVYRKGNVELLVYPDEKPVSVEGTKFRRATPEEIALGEGLYVREKYTRQTTKQVGEPKSVITRNNLY